MRRWTRPVLMVLGGLAVMAAGALPACDNKSDIGQVFSPKRPEVTKAPPPPVTAGVPRSVVPGVNGEPEIRVRILGNVGSVRLSSEIKALWVATAGGTARPARLTAPIEAKLRSDGWVLTDPAGVTARFERGAELELTGEEGAVGAVVDERGRTGTAGVTAAGTAARPSASPSSMVSVNGKRYPGLIRLSPRTDSAASGFDVVEVVALEEYLKGVVSSEMFKNWPMDAYRAQAVCARSYALHERMRARQRGERFDVESSVKDQAYDGVALNLAAAQAVRETRGAVLVWNGELLRSYYSSTCGGRPGSARDTWPITAGNEFNLAGPIQGQSRDHACQQATYYRWTASRSRTEISRRIRAWGQENGSPVRGLNSLASVRVDSTNAAGRPARYIVLGTNSQAYTLSAEELRRAMNQPLADLPPITPQNRVNSGDMEVLITGEQVTVTGRGWGHAVGMCQWCAKGFADRGEAWTAIVTRFYPGAKVERAY